MKLSGDALKNIDYKQFFVNHVEKFVLAIVVLISLYVLWSTKWMPYSGTPEEILTKVKDVDQKVEVATWPEEEQKKFAAASNLQNQVNKLLSPVDVTRYEFDREVFWPLYPRQEPVKEPEWIAPEGLVATASVGFFEAKPRQSSQPAQPQPVAQEVKPEEDLSAHFKVRTEGRPGAGNSGGMRFDASKVAKAVDTARIAAAQDQNREGVVKGFGLRYVAVRGVFDLKRQIQLLAKSMYRSASEVRDANLVYIVNFELQRQRAMPGENQWGEWQTLDTNFALSILDECNRFDAEVHDAAVTNQVITMPLPYRVFGGWGDEASHTKIEDYRLDADEVERQVAIHREIIDKLKDRIRVEEARVRPGGFSKAQFDLQPLLQEVNRNKDWKFDNELLKELAAESDTEKQNTRLRQQVEKSVSVSGQLLLLRYLDFEVDPGDIYRYRVRFQLWNPNYNRPPAQLSDPAVGVGETRMTPWSEPSAPVQVEDDARFFLAAVSNIPGAKTSLKRADMDVYQWYADSGTTISDQLRINLGQRIGGPEKVEVARPAAKTFKEEDVKFSTGSILLDAEIGPSLDPKDHPDLKLTGAQAREKLGIVQEVLVVNQFGELVEVDPVSRKAEHDYAKRLLEAQTTAFAQFKVEEKEEDAAGDLQERAKARRSGAEAKDAAGSKKKSKKGLSNPNQRGS